MSDLKELSQSQVPLERVAPLNSNRLVTFVNHFIVSIVQQLNELSSAVDSRLYDINNQMIRCNANLVILEMKLNSISGLSSVSSAVPSAVPSVINNNTDSSKTNDIPLPQTTTNTDSNSAEDLPQNQVTNDSPKSQTTTDETKPEETEEVNKNEEKAEEETEPEDPRIGKYKKMLSLGIPLGAVHHKMIMEGIDPNLLSA